MHTLDTLFQICMVLLLLNNMAMLFVSRLSPLVLFTAFQGVLMALLLLCIPRFGTQELGFWHMLFLVSAVICLKGIGFPYLLQKTLRRIKSDTSMSPYISFSLSVTIGVAALIGFLCLETYLSLPPELFPQFLFPVALSTIFTGLLLVIGRRKALTQVIGFLVTENGIFLLGIPLMVENSTWFELSLLLDVFVAVFVMGIAINHIHNTFESIDTGHFCSLRD